MKKKAGKKQAEERAEKFVWRAAKHPFGEFDAEVCGREIERLYATHGRELTAESVADAAQDPNSPLHAVVYHVDEEQAARLHFLERARLLMRMTVKITVIAGEEHVVRLVQPVSRPLGPTVYKDLPDIMSDPEYRECLLRNAIRELLAVKKKFAQLQELAVVFAAVEKVRKGVA